MLKFLTNKSIISQFNHLQESQVSSFPPWNVWVYFSSVQFIPNLLYFKVLTSQFSFIILFKKIWPYKETNDLKNFWQIKV